MYQVSWLRHTSPIPQLMALNNMSNSLDSRVKAMVGEDWSEFVLMVRDVNTKDSGEYECQVSGPNHTSLSKIVTLHVIGEEHLLQFCKYFQNILIEIILTLREGLTTI